MTDDQLSRSPKSHLLIAGTGRAGTTFLVRYLDAIGLETHLSREGGSKDVDSIANAGLEDLPLPDELADLPYVVKTPWLYQIIDQVLCDDSFGIEGVVVPVRRLVEASASRSIVEFEALHTRNPWMAKLDRTWSEWGYVPGGTTYSVAPIDQARILAVGFHQLIERLVATDIPVVLLAFPRLLEDPRYLFERLRPLIPHVELDLALDAHRRALGAPDAPTTADLAGSDVMPTEVEIENLALKRLVLASSESLRRTTAEVAALQAELEEGARMAASLRENLDRLKHPLRHRHDQLVRLARRALRSKRP